MKYNLQKYCNVLIGAHLSSYVIRFMVYVYSIKMS